ncbi:MAG TPA: hypothetical protein VGJ05_03050 [Fimbriiglobus sp.]|jgi:hypothetical protein
MSRLGWIAVVAAFSSCGCVTGWLRDPETGPKQTPVAGASVPDATIQMAARLSNVGQTLLTANPFAGVNPNFFVMSTAEPAVSHPDAFGVFVSEGMMAKCQTDDELAAVVALELGAMIAERRNLDRLGLADPAAAYIGGDDTTASPIQDPNAKVVSTARPKPVNEPPAAPEQIAKELLTAAGYREDALARMSPLVQSARDKVDPTRAIGGPAAEPKWSR